MIDDPTNLFRPGSHQEADEIVFQAMTVPKYRRRRLLAMVPGVNNQMFDTWIARGLFERSYVQGTAGRHELAALLIRENEARKQKLYTGSDVIALIVLELLSRRRIRLSMADDLIGMAQQRAAKCLDGTAEGHLVAVIGDNGKPVVRQAEDVELGDDELLVIVDLDVLVGNFTAAIAVAAISKE